MAVDLERDCKKDLLESIEAKVKPVFKG